MISRVLLAVVLTSTSDLSSHEAGARQSARELPSIVMYSDASRTEPLWVDAEEAVTVTGSLRVELFPNEYLAMRRDFGSTSSRSAAGVAVKQIHDTRCKNLIGGEIGCGGTFSPPQRVADLASHDSSVYLGKVLTIRPGFLGGSPRSLVKAEALEVIRPLDNALRRAQEPFFFVHQYARFEVGELTGCFGFQPIAAGDRFIAVVTHVPLDEQKLLFLPGDDVFIESEGGGLRASPGWKARLEAEFGHAPTFQEFLEAVRKSLKPQQDR